MKPPLENKNSYPATTKGVHMCTRTHTCMNMNMCSKLCLRACTCPVHTRTRRTAAAEAAASAKRPWRIHASVHSAYAGKKEERDIRDDGRQSQAAEGASIHLARASATNISQCRNSWKGKDMIKNPAGAEFINFSPCVFYLYILIYIFLM